MRGQAHIRPKTEVDADRVSRPLLRRLPLMLAAGAVLWALLAALAVWLLG